MSGEYMRAAISYLFPRGTKKIKRTLPHHFLSEKQTHETKMLKLKRKRKKRRRIHTAWGSEIDRLMSKIQLGSNGVCAACFYEIYLWSRLASSDVSRSILLSHTVHHWHTKRPRCENRHSLFQDLQAMVLRRDQNEENVRCQDHQAREA